MQYIVLCHTRHLDRSIDKNNRHHDVIRSHQMLIAVNRADAERMVERLRAHDDGVDYEDGPFIIQRNYEVGVNIFGPKGKVVLTMSDVEMIVSEYTKPKAPYDRAA